MVDGRPWIDCRHLLASSLQLHAAEHIKDTQDYLDIHLDSTQNRLIRLDLITAAATLSVALYTLFAGNDTH